MKLVCSFLEDPSNSFCVVQRCWQCTSEPGNESEYAGNFIAGFFHDASWYLVRTKRFSGIYSWKELLNARNSDFEGWNVWIAVMKIRWFASQNATYFRVLANQFDICTYSGANHYTACARKWQRHIYQRAMPQSDCIVVLSPGCISGIVSTEQTSVVTLCLRIQNCVTYIIFC